jgi:hypothetical protein
MWPLSLDQVRDRNSRTALTLLAGTVRFDQGMVAQLLPDGLTENACAFAVDEAHKVKTSHEGVIQVLVHAWQDLLYPLASQV